jgi:hypothetical protein
MIVEYNKFNIILYFLTGSIITISYKQWIYGIMISILCVSILCQTLILDSGNNKILKYQNIGFIMIHIIILFIIFISLYILMKSTIQVSQKMLSIGFLTASVSFSIYKQYNIENPIFQNSVTTYISSILFIIALLTIAIIPDNQLLLKHEYDEMKYKLT